MSSSAPKGLKFIPFHTRQAFSWDCGLACVCTVSKGLGKAFDSDEVLDGLSATSLWTIDLVMLLHKFGIKCRYYTRVLGVDAAHATLGFYADTFETDARRVTALIEEAKTAKIMMAERHLDIDYICETLHANSAVYILLVDLQYLKCTKCWKLGGLRMSYAGHYIVLLGYSYETNLIEYMDPASDSICCYCTPEALDRARSAPGTDEDVIEIPLASAEDCGS